MPSTLLTGFLNNVTSLEFSPDGSKLAIVTGGNSLRIHAAPNWAAFKVFAQQSKGINQVAFSPDSQFIATAMEDHTIKLWDAGVSGFLPDPSEDAGMSSFSKPSSSQNGLFNSVLTFTGHRKPVMSVQFSPNGALLASGSVDGIACLWSVSSGKLVKEFYIHTEPVVSVAFSHDSTLLVTASWDGFIRLTDVATKQTLRTLLGAENTPVSSVIFSPNSKYLLIATLDSTIRLWDYSKEKVEREYTGHKNVKYSLALKFSPWNTILYPSEDTSGYALCEWDVESEALVSKYPANNISMALSVHPHQKLIARGGLDKVVTLFSTDASLSTLQDPAFAPHSLDTTLTKIIELQKSLT